MRPEESWQYTPREYAAFVAVYEDHARGLLQRWALERSDFRNAHFGKDQFGNPKHWKPEEFLPSKPRPKQEATTSFEQEKLRLAGMMTAMRNTAMDEASIPAVFRMTPEEKAARANGRRNNR